MYARQFDNGPRFRPASLGAALAINGVVIAALMLASPETRRLLPVPPLIVFTPAPEPSPPPPDPAPSSRAQPQPARPAPRTALIPDQPLDDLIKPVNTGEGPILTPGTGGGGDAIDHPAQTPPAPALIGATFDQRYSRDIEPPYPDAARDAGTEGVVKLRLTIGADGRVKQAEPIAGDPILTRAAIRHVLARWRFKPATRGGVPEESSRVMTVRFRLDT